MKDKECYRCGQKGHIVTVCPAKKSNNDLDDDDKSKKSSSESSRRKNHSKKKKKEAEIFVQEDDEEDEESDNHGFASFGFCTVKKRNKLQLRNMLLLDSCSTVDLLCNKNLVTKIWESKNSMTVKGNGGDLKNHKTSYVKNYGEVCFDERAITNIMYLKNVKEKFRVTYDSNRYGTFTVHKPNEVNIKFGMHFYGLHYHDTVNRQVTMVHTVKENEKG